MKRLTIKELAKVLNLSTSTVSRALSDHPDISEETKVKVREASELYNYKPNLRARYLRTKSSGLIGLILPEYHMFFIPEMMKSISQAVSEKGFSLLIFQSDDSYEKELDIIDYCNQLSVDGIMISIGSGFHHSDELLKLNRDGAPLVFLDKVWENKEISSVGIDGELVAKNAVEYLVKKGHSKIAGVFSINSEMIAESRLLGFEKACSANNLDSCSMKIDNLVDFNGKFKSFLKENEGVTAIFTMTDELMIRCQSELQKNGYRIPEDISLISISDGVMTELLNPRITHFFHSPSVIGKTAVELLFQKINDKSAVARSVNIECQLVESDSVKNLKI
jgi:LacI family transcriptional regulator